MQLPQPHRIIFVTGTDTGVGKTVLTALLLDHLRHNGSQALAMKPFCSGHRGDVNLLHNVLRAELSPNEINPFHFPEPLAPLVAARARRRRIPLAIVMDKIRKLANRCEILLVEGAGGLLSPLGEKYSLLDLITRAPCEVLIAAKNQLGTLNHTLLTVAALRAAGISRVKVVLMNTRRSDASSHSNPGLLSELVAPVSVFVVPRIGRRNFHYGSIVRSRKRLKNCLSRILS